MKLLLLLVGWCLLLVLCWPLALLALLLAPPLLLLMLLLWLPFKLIGIVCEAIFAFIRAVFMLPARLLR